MIMNKNTAWVAYLTLSRKEIVRVFRIWPEALLPPVITMALYFMIFGKLVGSQIHPIAGFTYMQYIVPGLIIMPVITSSYVNSGFSFYIAKFSKSIEELLVAPISNHVIIFGYLTAGVLRSLVISILVLIVALFFTHFHIHNIFISGFIILITALIFSLAGLINGIYANKFDHISIVPTFILTPLTYLGGVFYSLQQLPLFAQYLSKINPIFYIVNAFREGMLGISNVNTVNACLILIALFGIFYIWTIYLLKNSHGLRS